MSKAALIGFALLLGSLGAVGPMAFDSFMPATRHIAMEFGVNAAEVQVTLAALSIGFAAGQLVHGPVSDRFGRRRAAIGALALVSIASLLATLATDLQTLALARALQGAAAAGGITIMRAIVRDRFDRVEAVRLLSYLTGILGVGPVLFPIVGGWLSVAYGWRSVMVFMAAYAALVGLLIWRFLGETNRRPDPMALQIVPMILTFGRVIRNPVFRAYLVCACFAQVGLFSFLAGSPAVLMEQMGETPDRYGIDYGIVMTGFMLGGVVGARIVGPLGMGGTLLTATLITAASSAVLVGLVAAGGAGVGVLLAPLLVFLLGFAMIMANASAGALSPFPDVAGTAASLTGFLQQICGATTTGLIAALDNGTAWPMAVLLAFGGWGSLGAYVFLVRPAEAARARLDNSAQRR